MCLEGRGGAGAKNTYMKNWRRPSLGLIWRRITSTTTTSFYYIILIVVMIIIMINYYYYKVDNDINRVWRDLLVLSLSHCHYSCLISVNYFLKIKLLQETAREGNTKVGITWPKTFPLLSLEFDQKRANYYFYVAMKLPLTSNFCGKFLSYISLIL